MSNADTNSNEAPARGKSVKGDKALESLVFKSRTTGAEAAARSRFVRRFRIILPIVAVVLVVFFIFSTQSNSVDQARLDDFKSIAASTEELRMVNPEFAGVDDNGKPYEITADATLQNPDAKNVFALENPRAVQGANEEQSVVSARSGLYRPDDNILELSNTVTLEHDVGANTYVLQSPEAVVSIKDQTVTSTAGVGAEGPDGTKLNADSMKAYRADGRVVFEGNVKMRIYPKSQNPAAPDLRDQDSQKDPT